MIQPNPENYIQPAHPDEVSPDPENLGLPTVADEDERTAYLSEYDEARKAGILLVTAALAEEKVTISAELEEQRKQAVTDELTGLPNRRGLVLKIEEAIAKNPGKVGVLFADIDGLKDENDTKGHKAGDQLIIRGSAALANGLGEHHTRGHMAARQSGDELVGVVEGVTSEEELELIGAGVRKSFDEAGIPVSLGVAMHRPGETATDVIARADEAMYTIKALRKDLKSEQDAQEEFDSLSPDLQQHYDRLAQELFDFPGADADQFFRLIRSARRR